MRLAGRLCKTLKELRRDLDPGEIAYWRALENLDGPMGEWRDDYRAATIAAASAAAPVNPVDLMPVWDREKREKIKAAREKAEEWKAQNGG